jgi:signal peptidase I
VSGAESVEHAPGAVAVEDGKTFRVQEKKATSTRENLTSWAITIGIAVGLTVLLRLFVTEVYSIPSESMVPTLKVGDRVVVSRLSKDPSRGDIIVFDRPSTDPKVTSDEPDVLIKRVIGLGGDVVDSRDGKVYVNGKRLAEDYLSDSVVTTIESPITVPSGQLLVLGDNRGSSKDGRVFGTISKDLVVGRAIAVIWPLGDATTL